MKTFRRLLPALSLLLPAATALAQTTQDASPPKVDNKYVAEVLDKLYVNLEPTDQIAPSLLGIGTSQVTKPGALNEVSLAVLQSFVNLPGKGSGVGVEVPVFPFLQKTLVAAPAAGDTVHPAVRSLREYRRNYWQRGFLLSGASVGDSLGSSVALGISYTFGSGQLDPLKAKMNGQDYAASIARRSEKIRQDSQHNPIADAFFATLPGQINEALKTAGVADPQDSRYDNVLDKVTHILALPVVGSGASNIPTTESLIKELTKEVNADNQLTSAQKTGFIQVLSERVVPSYLPMYTQYLKAVRPTFDALDTLVARSGRAFERQNWNADLLQVGVGQVWHTPNHTWGALSRQSVHGFLRLAVRPSERMFGELLHEHGQLVLNTQYVYHPNADTVQQRFWYGSRILLGNETLRFSVEYSAQRLRYRVGPDGVRRPSTTIDRWTVGVETRVADNLWLEVAIGTTSSPTSTASGGKNAMLSLATVKYGFQNKRRFTTH